MKMFRMENESAGSSSSEELSDNDVDMDNFRNCFGCADWDTQLICCSTCKRCYHNDCHIPPLSNTMASAILVYVDMEPWTCTMCIDMDHISQVMSEDTIDPQKKNKLDKNEMTMASRILLELVSDETNSHKFMNCPLQFRSTRYYEVIFLPVSLNSVKKRLLSKNSYYTSFTDVIVDIKRIYSNALFYYADDDPYNHMAQNQQKLLFELLAKWIPQYHTDPNNQTE